MKDEPQNKKGQEPTRTPEETVDRLEQKKQDDVGGANRERIEEKEQEITSER
jgi:hypothetical protein